VHGREAGIRPDLLGARFPRRFDQRDIVRLERDREGSGDADVVVLAGFDKLLEGGPAEGVTQPDEGEHERDEACNGKVAQQAESALAALGSCCCGFLHGQRSSRR